MSESTNFIWIYVTCGSEQEAKQIGRYLVEQKLIACANLFPQVTSIYKWDDQVQEENEVVMACKGQKQRFSEIEQKIVELHSYETPCIVALPILAGNQAYLDWLAKSS